MDNLNAFLKLRAKELHKSNKNLSFASELSQSYISRIFNNQQQITKIGAITPLLHELKLDKRTVQIKDKDFEDLFSKFIDAIYYITDDRHQLYQEIQSYKTKYFNHPYYLNILLSKFIYDIISKKDKAIVSHIINKFLYIYSSLSNQFKQLFVTFYLAYINFINNFSQVTIIQEKLKHTVFKDQKISGLYHYFLISYEIYSGHNSQVYQNFQKCEKIFSDTKNYNRLTNLEMKYSIYLKSIGFFQESIRRNLAIIQYYQSHNYRLNNISILENNIGSSYMLLHDYKSALTYFKRATLEIQDNEIYFEMAYCCYQLRKNKEARKYIELGKRADMFSECYDYLLDWLSFQLNKKYSLKAFNTLEKTLELYQHQMQESTKKLIITEMINYYRYNGEHEKALELLISLTSDTLHSPASLNLL